MLNVEDWADPGVTGSAILVTSTTLMRINLRMKCPFRELWGCEWGRRGVSMHSFGKW